MSGDFTTASDILRKEEAARFSIATAWLMSQAVLSLPNVISQRGRQVGTNFHATANKITVSDLTVLSLAEYFENHRCYYGRAYDAKVV